MPLSPEQLQALAADALADNTALEVLADALLEHELITGHVRTEHSAPEVARRELLLRARSWALFNVHPSARHKHEQAIIDDVIQYIVTCPDGLVLITRTQPDADRLDVGIKERLIYRAVNYGPDTEAIRYHGPDHYWRKVIVEHASSQPRTHLMRRLYDWGRVGRVMRMPDVDENYPTWLPPGRIVDPAPVRLPLSYAPPRHNFIRPIRTW